MDYSNLEIEVKNIPRLENSGDGRCCRRYFYQFINSLPAQNEMSLQVKQLDYKFIYSKEVYDLPKDISVYALVSTERFTNREAVFIVSTNEPEEDAIFMYGAYGLPVKIEKIFGAVESIQRDPRETWIKDNKI
jgi:hypothetical protein